MNLTNLFEKAMGVLPSVTFEYRHFVGSVKNDMRVLVPSYADGDNEEGWVACRGMVQPVQQSAYKDLGLDKSKRNVNAWGSIPLKTVTNQEQPDQIRHEGRVYNIVSVNEWNSYNGWANVTCVEDKRYAD
jgi:hypothetical protein